MATGGSGYGERLPPPVVVTTMGPVAEQGLDHPVLRPPSKVALPWAKPSPNSTLPFTGTLDSGSSSPSHSPSSPCFASHLIFLLLLFNLFCFNFLWFKHRSLTRSFLFFFLFGCRPGRQVCSPSFLLPWPPCPKGLGRLNFAFLPIDFRFLGQHSIPEIIFLSDS